MKKTIIKDMKNISLVAIMMAATIFAACSGEENIISTQPATGTFTLTVNASKGDDADTRVLTLDGTTLKATWKAGDVVTVYNVTRSADHTGSLIAQSDGKSTTLSGTLTGTIAVGDNLKLKFLSPDYSSQDGTLAGIASSCDYAEATVTVSSISGSSVTTSSATFDNKQSIVEFTLKNKATSADLNATSLTVYAGDNTIKVTPSSATNVLYVAIPGISSKTVYLSATASGTDYIYEKPSVTLTNGKYYGYTVSMDENPPAISQPLTFEAKVANATVTFTKGTYVANQIEYSIDGGSSWTTYSAPITLTNVGDKVYFRGDNAAYGTSNSSESSKFSFGSCYIYGNIMSLINNTGYATETELTADYTFANLFYLSNNLYSHPIKKLLLPATTLTNYCYSNMFSYCYTLKTVPELPATTLAQGCYDSMFYGCTGLTTAPALNATTLTESCYKEMFGRCTSLTTAPELPATTLALNCYNGMFAVCTSLTTAPELPATTLAPNCYNGMFRFCEGLTTAPELHATTLKESCYEEMFRRCTSLTTAPELPATTLSPRCYQYMFMGCPGLTIAPELPADRLYEDCYRGMFSGCTNLTTAPELPATKLYYGCYRSMFYGCTSLTTPPELPVKSLYFQCYDSMFSGCTGLAIAPELPATSLAIDCYSEMFSGCTSLTSAPNLPAPDVANRCYYGMFSDCTSLTSAPALPATTMHDWSYEKMFSGCTSLTTAPDLPATTLANSCYSEMFSGCTSLTIAPDLSATTLAHRCYYQMFKGCSSLNEVKCLATNISATDCTKGWLDGVSATGTFTKASGVDWSGKTGSDGIPSGWTVNEE